MSEGILLNTVLVNIVKILFLSPDIPCNGFKEKTHTNPMISFLHRELISLYFKMQQSFSEISSWHSACLYEFRTLEQ